MCHYTQITTLLLKLFCQILIIWILTFSNLSVHFMWFCILHNTPYWRCKCMTFKNFFGFDPKYTLPFLLFQQLIKYCRIIELAFVLNFSFNTTIIFSNFLPMIYFIHMLTQSALADLTLVSKHTGIIILIFRCHMGKRCI